MAGRAHPHGYVYRLVTNQYFVAIVGLIFLGLVIFPLARTYSQRRLVEQEIATVQAQIDTYEARNEELSELLSYLQSEQSLEEQARISLNLKKPGEGVIVIEDKRAVAAEAAQVVAESQRSNLEKWWRYFFN